MKIKQSLLAQMRAATQQLLNKGSGSAGAAIEQALAGLRGGQRADAVPPMRDINPPPAGTAAAAAAANQATQAAQAAAPVTPPPMRAADALASAQQLMARMGMPAALNGFDLSSFDLSSLDRTGLATPSAAAEPLPEGARFIRGSFHNHAGTRNYKLYIPSGYRGQPLPLLVMLHGCTQNPDDFAAGTRMNQVAEEKHCFVVYPEQAQNANQQRCWNWFNALDQQRDQGEPSLIAGIARQIIDEYPVNPHQVYVAGLSAGGAMAIIVGTLYPDLFAAVGVHSGLPYASAQDLPSALNAMKRGAPGARGQQRDGALPIIVFHGDRDTTVSPRNGEQVMAQRLHGQPDGAAPSVQSGAVPDGHRYTRTTHSRSNGKPLAEHWVVHGAGHAWSGGSQQGSYTDHKGPDASREMMRFFKTVS